MDDRGGAPAPTRFLVETALDLVARRLRMLGYDVETLPGATLDVLFRRAADEGRTVLTTSRHHPARWGAVPCLTVPADDASAVVRRVTDRFSAEHRPFSRCPCCNLELEWRPASEARGHAPEAIVARGSRMRHCPRCGRWFWPGSHIARLRVWLERASGRPVAPPADD